MAEQDSKRRAFRALADRVRTGPGRAPAAQRARGSTAARACGEALRILDHTGAVLRDEADDGALGRPEVDRGQLRDLLIDALPAGTINWAHKVTAARPDDRHRAGTSSSSRAATSLPPTC